MKFWTKILVAVLTLAMIASMVACNNTGDGTPTDSAAPQQSSSASSSKKPIINPDDPGTGDNKPTQPDAQPDATPIADALAGFVTGDLVDGKPVVVNGYAGSEFWTGTTLDGYALMTTNVNKDDTRAAIQLSVAVSELSVLKFKAKVDSDIGDQFSVIVDGAQNAIVGKRDAGEHDLSVILSEGEHTVVFVYQKDDSGFDGTDTVYLSKVTVEALGASIDGEKDAFYDDAKLVTVRNTNVEGANGGATAWIKNDGVGLYIFVQVIDSDPVVDTDGNIDSGDKVQVYLDFARTYAEEGLTGMDYRGTATTAGMKLGWVNGNPGGTFGGGYGFKNVSGLSGASAYTDNGYTVELFVPLAWNIISNNTIGLGIQVSNCTADGATPVASFYSAPIAEGAASWWSAYETLPEFELVA